MAAKNPTTFIRRRHFIQQCAVGALGLAGLAGRISSPATAAKPGASTSVGPSEGQRKIQYGDAAAFSFATLSAKAAALAQADYHPPEIVMPDILHAIDYDQYQKIRYAPEMTLHVGGDERLPVQLFHLGANAREAVRIHLVEGGKAREVVYSPDLFSMPDTHPARRLPAGVGFAGFRIMETNLKSDWFAAMGASYFRTAGPYDQYGISARGVAIDTALATGEEFPRFSAYWIEKGESDATVTIFALLDGPSITGAYRMTARRMLPENAPHVIDMTIDAELHARKPIARLGIAPFSSMYWYGENMREKAVDWRPEIHDSDGLAIFTGAGERIWRPLTNPPRVMTNTFIDSDVKGFGLIQRDRNQSHYLDDGVFYQKRSSVWVEPLEPWGEGEVQLVEIPTNDETFDNIVAYWSPKDKLQPGSPKTWRYKLSWRDDVPEDKSIARIVGTWTGIGGRPGHDRPQGARKFVVDFEGPGLEDLDRDSGVVWRVTQSRGTQDNVYAHPVVGQRGRWRAFVDISAEAGPDPVDLRGTLEHDGVRLGEAWQYQYFPAD